MRTALSPGWGLLISYLPSHGLRRGLHSCAALRLNPGGVLQHAAESLVLTHIRKPISFEICVARLKPRPFKAIGSPDGLTALCVGEEGHEAEVHVELLVAMEESQAGIVGLEIDFYFLVAADHYYIFYYS